MREIKFRAWVKTDKRMTPSFDFRQWDGNYLYPSNFGKVMIGDLEIMQYTGLHDKNGKEIYEGDIVELMGVDEETEKPYKKNLEVKFCAGSFTFQRPDTNIIAIHYEDYIQVIGNIFENPDC